jgi:hypothetical protein
MYATHPTTVHHAPRWLGPMLIVLSAILLAALALFAFEALGLRTFFAPTVNFTPSTEMLQRQFTVEHQGDVMGTSQVSRTQLQQFFVIEHQADMD